MERRFAKYEGLGNDFLVLDEAAWPLEDLTPALARALCDRHTGVGGDGLLWLGTDPAGADARLVILNADGSRPEMCGNGVRCVAAYLHDARRLRPDAELRLATDAGPRPSRVLGADGVALSVGVDMGAVVLAAAPVALVAGVRALPVDVGNPHAVVFDPVAPDDRMAVVHAAVARRDVWPHGVNVEFVAPGEGGAAGVRVRVHERGVGWTRACGTGAVAVAAAAVAGGHHGARAGEALRVALDGGPLWITVRAVAGVLRAHARGPARRVFAGTVAWPVPAVGEPAEPA